MSGMSNEKHGYVKLQYMCSYRQINEERNTASWVPE